MEQAVEDGGGPTHTRAAGAAEGAPAALEAAAMAPAAAASLGAAAGAPAPACAAAASGGFFDLADGEDSECLEAASDSDGLVEPHSASPTSNETLLSRLFGATDGDDGIVRAATSDGAEALEPDALADTAEQPPPRPSWLSLPDVLDTAPPVATTDARPDVSAAPWMRQQPLPPPKQQQRQQKPPDAAAPEWPGLAFPFDRLRAAGLRQLPYDPSKPLGVRLSEDESAGAKSNWAVLVVNDASARTAANPELQSCAPTALLVGDLIMTVNNRCIPKGMKASDLVALLKFAPRPAMLGVKTPAAAPSTAAAPPAREPTDAEVRLALDMCSTLRQEYPRGVEIDALFNQGQLLREIDKNLLATKLAQHSHGTDMVIKAQVNSATPSSTVLEWSRPPTHGSGSGTSSPRLLAVSHDPKGVRFANAVKELMRAKRADCIGMDVLSHILASNPDVAYYPEAWHYAGLTQADGAHHAIATVNSVGQDTTLSFDRARQRIEYRCSDPEVIPSGNTRPASTLDAVAGLIPTRDDANDVIAMSHRIVLETSATDFRAIFERFGVITSIQVHGHFHFAIVSFAHARDAQACLNARVVTEKSPYGPGTAPLGLPIRLQRQHHGKVCVIYESAPLYLSPHRTSGAGGPTAPVAAASYTPPPQLPARDPAPPVVEGEFQYTTRGEIHSLLGRQAEMQKEHINTSGEIHSLGRQAEMQKQHIMQLENCPDAQQGGPPAWLLSNPDHAARLGLWIQESSDRRAACMQLRAQMNVLLDRRDQLIARESALSTSRALHGRRSSWPTVECAWSSTPTHHQPLPPQPPRNGHQEEEADRENDRHGSSADGDEVPRLAKEKSGDSCSSSEEDAIRQEIAELRSKLEDSTASRRRRWRWSESIKFLESELVDLPTNPQDAVRRRFKEALGIARKRGRALKTVIGYDRDPSGRERDMREFCDLVGLSVDSAPTGSLDIAYAASVLSSTVYGIRLKACKDFLKVKWPTLLVDARYTPGFVAQRPHDGSSDGEQQSAVVHSHRGDAHRGFSSSFKGLVLTRDARAPHSTSTVLDQHVHTPAAAPSTAAVASPAPIVRTTRDQLIARESARRPPPRNIATRVALSPFGVTEAALARLEELGVDIDGLVEIGDREPNWRGIDVLSGVKLGDRKRLMRYLHSRRTGGPPA